MALGAPAFAKTLRWAGQNDLLNLRTRTRRTTRRRWPFLAHVYEGLVRYNKEFQIEPALATSWQQVSRRSGASTCGATSKFHDGTPFTADDVVFSFERAAAAAVEHGPYTCRASRRVRRSTTLRST